MLPPVLNLNITYQCQLRCTHCYLNREGLLNTAELNYQDIKKILDDAQANKVFLVPISGGDPLLHKDIFRIITDIVKKRLLPLLGITGVGIDRKLAERIKNSGAPCVQVSLDGENDDVNRAYRGMGVFDDVLHSIKNLRNAAVKTNLAICVSSANFDHLLNLLDMARDIGIYKVKVAFWNSFKRGGDEKYRELSNDEKYYIVEVCRNYERRYNLTHWIVSPNSEFKDANPNLLFSKYPPLIVSATGDFLLSEMGPKIGNIRNGLPSKSYTEYLLKKERVIT